MEDNCTEYDLKCAQSDGIYLFLQSSSGLTELVGVICFKIIFYAVYCADGGLTDQLIDYLYIY